MTNLGFTKKASAETVKDKFQAQNVQTWRNPPVSEEPLLSLKWWLQPLVINLRVGRFIYTIWFKGHFSKNNLHSTLWRIDCVHSRWWWKTQQWLTDVFNVCFFYIYILTISTFKSWAFGQLSHLFTFVSLHLNSVWVDSVKTHWSLPDIVKCIAVFQEK